MSAYATIEVEREGGWATLWFDRPERRNALSGRLVEETLDALARVRDDRSLRGLTFRGRGKVFSAGGDLKQFLAHNQGGEREPVMETSREIAALLDAVAAQPQVTVARVHGAAVAGGLGLMCACDHAMADAAATFALTETTLGLAPAQIAPFVIDRVGARTARRLMLSAATLRGEAALEAGLVDAVAVSDAEMDAREEAFRDAVRRAAPGAVANLKALLRALPGRSRAEQVELAAASFADALLSAEAREGIAAFFDRRAPTWAGDA